MARLLHVDLGVEAIREFPRHQHAAWVVIVYVEGDGWLTLDDRRIRFRVGSVVCVPPQTPYAESSPAGFRSLFMLASGPLEGVDGVQAFDEPPARPLHRLAGVLLDEFQLGPRARSSSQALFEALLVLLRERLRGAARLDEAERLREAIAANLENARFAIGDAIAALPWSAAHVRKVFARSTGMTPRAYLTSLRIAKAKRLLRIGGLSIKQIAFAVGIADAHYFSRLFRAGVGCWPSAYGRGHAEPDATPTRDRNGQLPRTPGSRRP